MVAVAIVAVLVGGCGRTSDIEAISTESDPVLTETLRQSAALTGSQRFAYTGAVDRPGSHTSEASGIAVSPSRVHVALTTSSPGEEPEESFVWRTNAGTFVAPTVSDPAVPLPEDGESLFPMPYPFLDSIAETATVSARSSDGSFVFEVGAADLEDRLRLPDGTITAAAGRATIDDGTLRRVALDVTVAGSGSEGTVVVEIEMAFSEIGTVDDFPDPPTSGAPRFPADRLDPGASPPSTSVYQR